jgi:hypothetical protein
MKSIVGAILVCAVGLGVAQAQPNWVQLSPSTAPPGREAAAMAYDGARRQIVMFGGAVVSGADFIIGSDTWLWDGQNWHATSPSTLPPARDRACVIYDPRIQKVVMFGGENTAQLRDTWLWDGANWTLQATPGGAPLAGTCYQTFGYDEARQQAILITPVPSSSVITSQTWSWDGAAWTQLHPLHVPPVLGAGEQMAYDRARGELLLTAYTDNPNNNNFASTWAWNGTDWIRKPPAGDHLPYDFNPGQAVYDAVHQQVLIYLEFQQTWAWDGTAWSLLHPATSPADRILPAAAFDELHQRVVLFGGGGGVLYADTWAYMDPLQSVQITVPAGVQYAFNGVGYTGSQTVQVAAGTYTLSTTTPQATGVGTQMVFSNWSDGGAISHPVTVGSSAVNITGTLGAQYLLTTAANPSSGGSVSGGGYYDAGTIASPSATPNAGFSFANWSGACSGSGACPVTMNAPATVTANFNAALVQFTVNVPAAAQFTFNGTTYTGTQTIPAPPAPYVLSTTTPQSTGVGAQLAFVSWSDGGAISHTVTLSGVTQSVTGTFKTQYLLTTSALPVNAGVVAPLSGGPYFDSGTLANVGSVANAGFQFQYWTGACAGSALVCQVLMNAPQTVVGNFTAAQKWIQLGPANSPQARAFASEAFDAGRNEIVLFGGYDSTFNYFPETWTWNGVNWTSRASAGPSPRFDSAMAYDPVHGQMVLFGGESASTLFLGDTWIWDGAAGVWTKQNPVSSPSARYGASLAWDGTRLILFGGGSSAGYLNDTWAWTGSNWVQLAPAASPPARSTPAITYDAARNQVVLFGGINAAGVVLGDTWIWTGTNWVAKAPAASPLGRDLAMFAYDPVIQQSVLFGGRGGVFPDEVWLWDGTNWRSVAENPSPSDRAGGTMAYDAARQQVVLFGGYDPIVEGDTWIFANNAVQQFYTLTTAANPAGAGAIAAVSRGQAGPSYRAGSTVTLTASSSAAAPFGYWSGACAGAGSGSCTLTMLSNLTAIANYPPQPKWIQLGPAKMPQGRYGAAMAFDANRAEVVLFSGGLQQANGQFGNETWIWDGTSWSQRLPAVSPPARYTSAMAYDVTRQQVVMFGGKDASTLYGDTWVWDGAAGAWTQKHPAHSPSARAASNMAWDGSRLILFGGFLGAADTAETWAWDGTDWTLLAAGGGPPAREYAMMTFDPVRRQVMLFGGQVAGAAGFLNDTWIWDGTAWTKRFPATSPTGRSAAAMAWHDAIQQVVLFSGLSSAFAADTWLWDGTNWRLHAEPLDPSLQWGSAAAWDGARQQLVLLSHYAGDLEGMWIYASNAVQQFYSLTTSASPAAGGTVSPAGTQSLRAGSLVSVVATAAAGLEFQGWTGACAGSQRACPVFLNGNLTVTANFGFPMSWLQLNPATNAAPKGNLIFENPISMAFDVARQQVVYYGGLTGDQTWTWSGITWTKRTPAHSPPARSGHAMAYDAARQRVILFGGGNAVAFNDTWAWDGADWTLVDPGTGPGKRFNHAMAYDRVRQEIVLFGGLDENFNFYLDTWAWNGAQWIRRQASGGPPLRSDFGMAYDPVNAEVLLSSAIEGASDTWGWNGSVWTQKSPLHAPPSSPNHFKQMAYDERLQRTVMLVDNYPGAPQTWVWDGADWTQLVPTQNPTPRFAGGIVYDGVRGQVLLFGGDGPGPLNDTWVFAPPTAILTLQSVSAAKNAAGNYLVTFAVKNTGNTTAKLVFALSATAVTVAGGASTTTNTFPLGQFSDILPGTTGTFQAQFPASAGPGAHSFSAQGAYGTVAVVGSSWSVAVRSVVFP